MVDDKDLTRSPERPAAAVRALRMVAAGILVLVGVLCCLIAFGLPRESGEISRPGLLIPWYVLPVTDAAAVRAWPGGARRTAAPLVVAVVSIAGWFAVLMLW